MACVRAENRERDGRVLSQIEQLLDKRPGLSFRQIMALTGCNRRQALRGQRVWIKKVTGGEGPFPRPECRRSGYYGRTL